MAKIKNVLKGTMILVIIGLIVVISFLKSFYIIINPGTVGVRIRLGKVVDVLHEGFSTKLPIDKVVIYNTKLLTYETSDNPDVSLANYTDYPVDTTTVDGQPVEIKYTVRFRIDPNKAQWVYQNLGTEQEVVEKIVKTDSRIHVRGLAKNYTAQDLYTGNIRKLEEDVTNTLAPIFAENGLILDEFGIRDIDFDEAYVKVIEQKQQELERVEVEKYKAEQEKFKKQAKITAAEGDAQVQKLLQQSLTKELLMKTYLEKWDGKLPEVMCDKDNQMILDLNSLKR